MTAPETTPTRSPIKVAPSGKVIAENVSYEDFLHGFDAQHVEWVNGKVIEMPAVYIRHGDITSFLISLFRVYFSMVPENYEKGRILHEPVVMRPRPDLPGRSPDVMVVMDSNSGIIKDLQIAGPADLVVEVVSESSERRDYMEKLLEYEAGGVREYWIVDPIIAATSFWQRGTDGEYQRARLDDNNSYHSAVLQGFKLDADIFWRADLPRINVVQLVQEMLRNNQDNDANQEAQDA
jgi:Uma2 family endonuclease